MNEWTSPSITSTGFTSLLFWSVIMMLLLPLLFTYLTLSKQLWCQIFMRTYWISLKWCFSVKLEKYWNFTPSLGAHFSPETDSFCRFSVDLPENLRKLSAHGKSLHQKIRRNSGTLHSGGYVCYYLLMSFIQRSFKFFNEICLIWLC